MSTSAAVHNSGFEWRILLGSTHSWPAPEPQTGVAREQFQTVERCELCREPIDDLKPFVTNTAGGQPMHLACLQRDTAYLENESCSTRRTWMQRIFRAFVNTPATALVAK